MNNDAIKALRSRVQSGSSLTQDEQLQVLQSLLRANHRIQAAKRAGYRESEADSREAGSLEMGPLEAGTLEPELEASSHAESTYDWFLPPRL